LGRASLCLTGTGRLALRLRGRIARQLRQQRIGLAPRTATRRRGIVVLLLLRIVEIGFAQGAERLRTATLALRLWRRGIRRRIGRRRRRGVAALRLRHDRLAALLHARRGAALLELFQAEIHVRNQLVELLRDLADLMGKFLDAAGDATQIVLHLRHTDIQAGISRIAVAGCRRGRVRTGTAGRAAARDLHVERSDIALQTFDAVQQGLCILRLQRHRRHQDRGTYNHTAP
jgi:hypothetical protein